MDDVVAAHVQLLGEEPPMGIAPPVRFRVHEARARLGECAPERALPLSQSHPCGIATECGGGDAGEAFLARFTSRPPAELDGMAVSDPGLLERPGQLRLIALWVRLELGTCGR